MSFYKVHLLTDIKDLLHKVASKLYQRKISRLMQLYINGKVLIYSTVCEQETLHLNFFELLLSQKHILPFESLL